MITINRIGGNPLGVSQYAMRLNGNIISPSFDHDRTDDLPTLLRKAADQVIIERSNHADAVYRTRAPAYTDGVPTIRDVMTDIKETITFLEAQCDKSDILDEKLAWQIAIDTLAVVVKNYDS